MPYMTRKTQGYSFREYLQGASRWNCRSVWEIANRIRRSQDYQGMAGCPQSQPCHEQVWSFSTVTSHALTISMDGGCPGFWTHPCHYWATLAEVRIPSSRPVTVSLAAVCDHCLLSSHPALREPGPLLPINPHWVVEDCTEILPRALGQAQLGPTDWEQHQGHGLPQLTKQARTAARKKGGGRRDHDNSFALMVHICPVLWCSSLVAEQQ